MPLQALLSYTALGDENQSVLRTPGRARLKNSKNHRRKEMQRLL